MCTEHRPACLKVWYTPWEFSGYNSFTCDDKIKHLGKKSLEQIIRKELRCLGIKNCEDICFIICIIRKFSVHSVLQVNTDDHLMADEIFLLLDVQWWAKCTSKPDHQPCILISCNCYFIYLFIKALLHKCWRSVGHQVLQPDKDIEFGTVCFKSCRQEKNPWCTKTALNLQPSNLRSGVCQAIRILLDIVLWLIHLG